MRRVTVTALASVVGAAMLTGCVSEPEGRLTVDDVIAERAEAINDVARDRFDAFLAESRDRLIELELPLPRFQGVVPREQWGSVVKDCIERFDAGPQVTPLEGGFQVDYFAVVGEPYERIQWAVDSCSNQYGVDAHDALDAGEIELAWRFQDATQRLLPCLRDIDVPVPNPPSVADFAARFDTPREWTAFAFAFADLTARERALRLCPPTSTVLDAALELDADGPDQ